MVMFYVMLLEHISRFQTTGLDDVIKLESVQYYRAD